MSSSKIQKNEIKSKIINDPDYISLPQFKNSMQRCIQKYPKGVPNHIIAKALQIHTEEVERTYQSILQKLAKMVR